MSRINLNKYKAELEKAWADLHKPDSKNDWVVFGYEGKTFDLKIVGTGEDGFEEMVEDLSDGKILYAGCRVNDPNTNLPKIVFVNWQGEGVPTNVKGTCANHIRDVTNLFRGAHVTVNARSEDDLDYDAVLEKVKKSSGSNYSFHKEKPKPAEKIKPVGAVYKKINPEAEINTNKRDAFWSKQEKDEKTRLEQEKIRIQKEREEEDRKRREREAKEATVREEAIRERSRSIDQQRAANRALEQKRKEEEKKKYEETLKDAERDDQEFRSRSDSERRRRLQEAQKMIKGRQISMDEERKRFEAPAHQKAPPPTIPKKTVRKPVAVPVPRPAEPTHEPVEPVRQPEEPTPQLPEPVQPAVEPAPVPKQEPVHVEEEPEQPEEPAVQDQFYDQTQEEQIPQSDNFYEALDDASAQPAQPEQRQDAEPQPEPEQQDNVYDTVAEETPSSQEPARDDNLYDTVADDQSSAQAQVTSSSGMTVKALFDYQAEGDDEISFYPDDIITNVDTFDEGWWRGTAPNGHQGMFPSNYVEVLTDEAKSDQQPSTVEESQPASQGLRARALYDYQASDETEITFDPDDVITDIEQIDEGWWRGTGPNGQFGLFPANYVELI